MKNHYIVTDNPCPRCQKQRIIKRQWSETIHTASGDSMVMYTETVCPDPKCQAALEKAQEEKNYKSANIKKAADERAQLRFSKSKTS